MSSVHNKVVDMPLEAPAMKLRISSKRQGSKSSLSTLSIGSVSLVCTHLARFSASARMTEFSRLSAGFLPGHEVKEGGALNAGLCECGMTYVFV